MDPGFVALLSTLLSPHNNERNAAETVFTQALSTQTDNVGLQLAAAANAVQEEPSRNLAYVLLARIFRSPSLRLCLSQPTVAAARASLVASLTADPSAPCRRSAAHAAVAVAAAASACAAGGEPIHYPWPELGQACAVLCSSAEAEAATAGALLLRLLAERTAESAVEARRDRRLQLLGVTSPLTAAASSSSYPLSLLPSLPAQSLSCEEAVSLLLPFVSPFLANLPTTTAAATAAAAFPPFTTTLNNVGASVSALQAAVAIARALITSTTTTTDSDSKAAAADPMQRAEVHACRRQALAQLGLWLLPALLNLVAHLSANLSNSNLTNEGDEHVERWVSACFEAVADVCEAAVQHASISTAETSTANSTHRGFAYNALVAPHVEGLLTVVSAVTASSPLTSTLPASPGSFSPELRCAALECLVLTLEGAAKVMTATSKPPQQQQSEEQQQHAALIQRWVGGVLPVLLFLLSAPNENDDEDEDEVQKLRRWSLRTTAFPPSLAASSQSSSSDLGGEGGLDVDEDEDGELAAKAAEALDRIGRCFGSGPVLTASLPFLSSALSGDAGGAWKDRNTEAQLRRQQSMRAALLALCILLECDDDDDDQGDDEEGESDVWGGLLPSLVPRVAHISADTVEHPRVRVAALTLLARMCAAFTEDDEDDASDAEEDEGPQGFRAAHAAALFPALLSSLHPASADGNADFPPIQAAAARALTVLFDPAGDGSGSGNGLPTAAAAAAAAGWVGVHEICQVLDLGLKWVQRLLAAPEKEGGGGGGGVFRVIEERMRRQAGEATATTTAAGYGYGGGRNDGGGDDEACLVGSELQRISLVLEACGACAVAAVQPWAEVAAAQAPLLARVFQACLSLLERCLPLLSPPSPPTSSSADAFFGAVGDRIALAVCEVMSQALISGALIGRALSLQGNVGSAAAAAAAASPTQPLMASLLQAALHSLAAVSGGAGSGASAASASPFVDHGRRRVTSASFKAAVTSFSAHANESSTSSSLDASEEERGGESASLASASVAAYFPSFLPFLLHALSTNDVEVLSVEDDCAAAVGAPSSSSLSATAATAMIASTSAFPAAIPPSVLALGRFERSWREGSLHCLQIRLPFSEEKLQLQLQASSSDQTARVEGGDAGGGGGLSGAGGCVVVVGVDLSAVEAKEDAVRSLYQLVRALLSNTSSTDAASAFLLEDHVGSFLVGSPPRQEHKHPHDCDAHCAESPYLQTSAGPGGGVLVSQLDVLAPTALELLSFQFSDTVRTVAAALVPELVCAALAETRHGMFLLFARRPSTMAGRQSAESEQRALREATQTLVHSSLAALLQAAHATRSELDASKQRFIQRNLATPLPPSSPSSPHTAAAVAAAAAEVGGQWQPDLAKLKLLSISLDSVADVLKANAHSNFNVNFNVNCNEQRTSTSPASSSPPPLASPRRTGEAEALGVDGSGQVIGLSWEAVQAVLRELWAEEVPRVLQRMRERHSRAAELKRHRSGNGDGNDGNDEVVSSADDAEEEEWEANRLWTVVSSTESILKSVGSSALAVSGADDDEAAAFSGGGPSGAVRLPPQHLPSVFEAWAFPLLTLLPPTPTPLGGGGGGSGSGDLSVCGGGGGAAGVAGGGSCSWLVMAAAMEAAGSVLRHASGSGGGGRRSGEGVSLMLSSSPSLLHVVLPAAVAGLRPRSKSDGNGDTGEGGDGGHYSSFQKACCHVLMAFFELHPTESNAEGSALEVLDDAGFLVAAVGGLLDLGSRRKRKKRHSSSSSSSSGNGDIDDDDQDDDEDENGDTGDDDGDDDASSAAAAAVGALLVFALGPRSLSLKQTLQHLSTPAHHQPTFAGERGGGGETGAWFGLWGCVRTSSLGGGGGGGGDGSGEVLCARLVAGMLPFLPLGDFTLDGILARRVHLCVLAAALQGHPTLTGSVLLGTAGGAQQGASDATLLISWPHLPLILATAGEFWSKQCCTLSSTGGAAADVGEVPLTTTAVLQLRDGLVAPLFVGRAVLTSPLPFASAAASASPFNALPAATTASEPVFTGLAAGPEPPLLPPGVVDYLAAKGFLSHAQQQSLKRLTAEAEAVAAAVAGPSVLL